MQDQGSKSIDNADADGGDLAQGRILRYLSDLHHSPARQSKGDVGTRDRGTTRAAIGLDNVAIEKYLPLAQLSHVDDCSQAPADKTLDLCSSARRPLCLSLCPRIGRTREHRVLGRDPADPFIPHKERHSVLDAGGADHLCAADLDKAEPSAYGEMFGVILVCEAGRWHVNLTFGNSSKKLTTRRLLRHIRPHLARKPRSPRALTAERRENLGDTSKPVSGVRDEEMVKVVA